METVDYTNKKKGQKPFRLTSLEDPTDEQLNYIMEKVGIAARESFQKAKEEMDRRLQEVKRLLAEKKKQTYNG